MMHYKRLRSQYSIVLASRLRRASSCTRNIRSIIAPRLLLLRALLLLRYEVHYTTCTTFLSVSQSQFRNRHIPRPHHQHNSGITFLAFSHDLSLHRIAIIPAPAPLSLYPYYPYHPYQHDPYNLNLHQPNSRSVPRVSNNIDPVQGWIMLTCLNDADKCPLRQHA